MAITAYKLLKGSTQSALSQAVQLELSLGNRALVYSAWSRGGYLCQGVGTGTIDQGTVSSYFIITHTNDESFAALLNTNLPYYQPVGAPVIHNSGLYQVMAVVTPSANPGTPGKSPVLRVSSGYIQWKYDTDTTWTNLIALSAITGPSVQLTVDDGAIKWKQSNEMYWEVLVSLDDLKGPANTLTMGSVDSGDTPVATITGTPPNQTLNLTLQRGEPGPANNLSVGIVSTLEPGQPATVIVAGDSPSQVLNFGIPAGKDAVTEIVTGMVETQGTAVALTFTKTYNAAPAIVPLPQWNGTQMVTGDVTDVTTTGCNFTAMQSTTSGGFEYAETGKTFSVMVIGN